MTREQYSSITLFTTLIKLATYDFYLSVFRSDVIRLTVRSDSGGDFFLNSIGPVMDKSSSRTLSHPCRGYSLVSSVSGAESRTRRIASDLRHGVADVDVR